MPRIPVTRVALIGIITVLAAGCAAPEPVAIEPPTKDYDRPLAPGELALRKITDPAMLPAFGRAFYSVKDGTLERAIRNSLNYLAKPSSRAFFPYGEITHERATATLNDFLTVVQEATGSYLDGIVRFEGLDWDNTRLRCGPQYTWFSYGLNNFSGRISEDTRWYHAYDDDNRPELDDEYNFRRVSCLPYVRYGGSVTAVGSD